MDTLTIPEVDYSRFPPGDGDSMPDIEDHRVQLSDLIFSLQLLTKSWPRVHVGGNHFVYYNPDNPRDNCAPDVYVAIGVERRGRPAYYAWVERTFPQVVMEILSPSNDRKEVAEKLRLYAQQGVQEYYVIDPRRGPPTRLTGYVRQSNDLVPVPQTTLGVVRSDLLGTELRVDGKWVRVVDPQTRGFVPTPDEVAAARVLAEHARVLAEHARVLAEHARDQAEQAQHQAELERNQAEQAQHQAEVERNQAEQAQHQAEVERNQAELERNQAELERNQAEQAQHQAEVERHQAEARVQREAEGRNAAEAALAVAMAKLERLRGSRSGETGGL